MLTNIYFHPSWCADQCMKHSSILPHYIIEKCNSNIYWEKCLLVATAIYVIIETDGQSESISQTEYSVGLFILNNQAKPKHNTEDTIMSSLTCL